MRHIIEMQQKAAMYNYSMRRFRELLETEPDNAQFKHCVWVAQQMHAIYSNDARRALFKLIGNGETE